MSIADRLSAVIGYSRDGMTVNVRLDDLRAATARIEALEAAMRQISEFNNCMEAEGLTAEDIENNHDRMINIARKALK